MQVRIPDGFRCDAYNRSTAVDETKNNPARQAGPSKLSRPAGGTYN